MDIRIPVWHIRVDQSHRWGAATESGRVFDVVFYCAGISIATGRIAKAIRAVATLFAFTYAAGAVGQDQRPFDVDPVAIGSPDAPVEVVELVQFTCPVCWDFHQNAGFASFYREKFIEQGLVRWEFREVYSNRYDLWMSMMVHCGASDRKFDRIAGIFDNFRDLFDELAETGTTRMLYEVAAQNGLSKQELDACFGDKDFATTLVDSYEDFLSDSGIEAPRTWFSPMFIVNGQVIGSGGEGVLVSDLRRELKRAIDAGLP